VAEDRQSVRVASRHGQIAISITDKSILIFVSSLRERIVAMGPKLLGGGASLLAAAFILALPSVFKGEPADEVEPIRLGPPPVTELADAVQVTAPAPRPLEPSPTAPTPVTPAADPAVASGAGEDRGETAAAGRGQGKVSGDPGDDEGEGEGRDEDESESVSDGYSGADPGDDGSDDLDESESDEIGEDGDESEEND
jgi:hypothetical protein